MIDKNVKIVNVAVSPSCEGSFELRGSGREGFVLLVTLVVLMVLTVMSYILTSKVSRAYHRQQYMIDYQNARYGCDSGAKYSFAALEEMEEDLISRPNEPDFSDLFAMTEKKYRDFLLQWYDEEYLLELEAQDFEMEEDRGGRLAERTDDSNDIDDGSDAIIKHLSMLGGIGSDDRFEIRGPYGASWPFVTEPAEIMIGNAKVTIEIEDENAKYPLSWVLLEDPEIQREIDAGFLTFFEWMYKDRPEQERKEIFQELDVVFEELEAIREIKQFKFEYKPIIEIKRTPAPARRRTRRGRRTSRSKAKTITIPATVHSEDIAKLLHSPLLDIELLSRPTIVSDKRKESPLKYIGLWGTKQVNINTAPRHVLEATFVFGGRGQYIAEEIIQRRRIKPFEDIEELRREVFSYTTSIDKCERYITFKSSVFTIKVTATSGAAEASTIIAVRKEGSNVERIAMMSG